MRFVWATSRVEVRNAGELMETARKYDGAIAVLWHEEVATVAFAYPKVGIVAHTLASVGDAGELVTRVLERCGYQVFRGGASSRRSRRRTAVLRDMVEHMRSHHAVVYGLTVDGSKGPAYRMKGGAIWIARECGVPLALMRTWYRRCVRLRTWDRTAIPLPFNHIIYYFRGPAKARVRSDRPRGGELQGAGAGATAPASERRGPHLQRREGRGPANVSVRERCRGRERTRAV
jgi:lysophospholipid acyltransferase (LPLAT)-like uncharacterized protein